MSIMAEISCSIGDLSSTPSNRSEYFSINSSLSILNSTEEVYHSLSEDNETEIQGNFLSKFQKIVKQQHLDLEDNCYKLSVSDAETIPEPATVRNSSECEFWENCVHPLHVQKSLESTNSREEEDDEINNSSTFSNSQIKESSVIEQKNKNSSDDDESGSSSIINASQLNSCHIDRELSDLNDIVCDLSISHRDDNNRIKPEDNANNQSETENDIISESFQSRKEALNINDESVVIDLIKETSTEIESIQPEKILPVCEKNKLQNEHFESKSVVFCDEIEIKENKVEEIKIINENEAENCVTSNTGNNKVQMENDTPPVKRFYLCCSFRNKNTEKPKSKNIQKSKAKRFLSLFKKPIHDKKCKAEPIITEPKDNQNKNIIVKSIDIDYDAIPFIDADVGIDSETFISLATQELFSE